MEILKLNYEKTMDVLNEITSYLKSNAVSLEQLISSISSIDDGGAWNCPNASLLKDYELKRCKELVKHFEMLSDNFDRINNNLNSYNSVEKKLINELDAN